VLLCLLFLNNLLFAQTDILEAQIQVPNYQGSARIIIDRIAESENNIFAYTSKVSLNYEVKFQKQTISLKKFLDIVLDGRAINYKVNGNKIMFIPNKESSTPTKQLKQTVRGSIIDSDSKLPLIGAAIVLLNSNPLIGTITDMVGDFRMDNIQLGRINLKLSYLGYETEIVADIIVNSAKEVVLNLTMDESVISIEEVVVRPKRINGIALNDMAVISSRAISAEELKRYAEPFNDPSRAMANFAGVTATQDGSNDIIIRGNSPKYIQWRLEGVEITSPNHFADQNGVGSGGTSTLNNDLLATSDFYTGAFAPEFGDVLSGVYEIQLRNGNNEKNEFIFGIGVMGTDITAEGPFKKGYSGSYLANYRYSTIGLLSELGIVDVSGTPAFQDATFKVVLPTEKAGTFSIFFLGGMSGYHNTELEAGDSKDVPGGGTLDNNYNNEFKTFSYLANTGIIHTLRLTESSYLKTSLAFSGNGLDEEVYESEIFKNENSNEADSTGERIQVFGGKIRKETYRANVILNKKINSRHKIQVGVKYNYHKNNYLQISREGSQMQTDTLANFNENIMTLRNFIAWRYRINERLTLVSGIHNMNVLYNNKSTIEPRAAMSWNINPTNTLSFGYGNHSNMEKAHNYFARIQKPDGTISEPNRDLDLLKAHHFVVGYEKHFANKMMAKLELYYQDLYSLPVENIDTSYYSTINEGGDFNYVELVNKGVGKNYGIEFTLERFFNNNYYWMLNTSYFQSIYKALEGIERNTRYNSNYIVNFLAGKDFINLGKKNNQVLSINLKAYFGGGQKIIPLLRDDNGDLAIDPANNTYWDYSKAYDSSLESLYRIDLSISYKWNKPKTTHELLIDFYNLSDTKGKLTEYYDPSEPGAIGYNTQYGFFPNIMYRLYEYYVSLVFLI